MTVPSEQALERLAELCGILPGYVDVEGAYHVTSPATRGALLAAMGVASDSAEAVAAAIAVREDGPWRRPLPPVAVLRAGARAVAVHVPERLATGGWSYRIVREDGGVLEGALRPADLPLEGERSVAGEVVHRYRWETPELPLGYHRLRLEGTDSTAEALLVIAPERCYLPRALTDDGRVWGPSLQLFALHSHRNWGIGDFTDLRQGLEFFAAHGAGTVGLGPLHSLFPHNPEHASPYSPSNRSFWNVLYLDVEAVPGLERCERARARLDDPEFRARIAAARDLEIIDYSEVASLKREVLDLLFADFRARELSGDTAPAREFRQFQEAHGDGLHRHALFEALAEHFHAADPHAWGWPAWPEGHEHPETPAVQAFAAEHSQRVEFFAWLQWLAERQLAAAAARSAELGFGVGLYMDMPLGVDSGGSEVWAGGDLFTHRASAGAPPDDFNLRGQSWGLLPWIPERLFECGYAPFVELLRRNMRHAGALRLDHVMSLMRLFWIPVGGVPADGAYVRYPLNDLLGILALESHRNRCAVIGEDLGTVPDELRAALAPMGVLSNRVSYFEKDPDGEFPPPANLPRQCLVTVSNHDLPTLRGYWRGDDIALRQQLALYASDHQREAQVVARVQDRARLLFALGREGLLPENVDADPMRVPDLPQALMVAIHRYLARGPSMVLTFQMEDALGVVSQVNVPGTTSEHPNWRRKLPVALERWADEEPLVALLDALCEERGSGAASASAGRQRALVIPGATYRLQLSGAFTFRDVQRLVPYLARLGISHCYLSPFLKARPGSSHGYDVIDHRALNPEIGSRDDLDALAAALARAGMGQIADIVPNHMGVMGSDNAWWLDVLENGQASPYADYFDIDWHPVRPELRDKVLVPLLGDDYGTVLEQGELRLELAAGAGTFAVHYYEHTLPLDPMSYGAILALDVEVLADQLGADHVDFAEYQSVLRAFEHLPSRTETDVERRDERLREKEVAKRRLHALCAANPLIRQHVETNVARVSGHPGQPESFAMLHDLLERQAWRLAHWQVAADEINYRRFFDINDLAALRTELPDLLRATHELVAELYRDGTIDGLRIDHPDGLFDPAGYLSDLQSLVAGAEAAPDPQAPADPRCYVVVEKILAPYEHLPEGWAAHGTTGYDFAFLTSALTVFPEAEEALDRCYRTFVGQSVDFDELVYQCKKLVIRVHLSSELTMLANLLNRISQADWHTRDFTLNGLRDALAEIVASFPVYRTYVTPRGAGRRRPPLPGLGHLLGPPPRPGDRSRALRVHPRTGTAGARRLGVARLPGAVRALRHETPAIHLAGDGEGAGGHQLLPLPAAPVAVRRGRRSAPLRRVGGRVPPPQSRTGPALAPRHAGGLHPRQQAQRGCAGPAQRAHRAVRRMGAAGGPLAAPERGPATQPRRRPGPGAPRRVFLLPESAGHLASGDAGRAGARGAGRAPHGLPEQGRARGQGVTRAGCVPTRATRPRWRNSCAAAWIRRAAVHSPTTWTTSCRGSPCSACTTVCLSSPCGSPPRGCPISTRGTSSGTSAWWIPTTGVRWISAAARRCSNRWIRTAKATGAAWWTS